jgi:hypothetical protein
MDRNKALFAHLLPIDVDETSFTPVGVGPPQRMDGCPIPGGLPERVVPIYRNAYGGLTTTSDPTQLPFQLRAECSSKLHLPSVETVWGPTRLQ